MILILHIYPSQTAAYAVRYFAQNNYRQIVKPACNMQNSVINCNSSEVDQLFGLRKSYQLSLIYIPCICTCLQSDSDLYNKLM